MPPTLAGKFYSINVPLKDGTADDTFHALFKPIMRKVMEVFQPGAIVMQCGGWGGWSCSLVLLLMVGSYCAPCTLPACTHVHPSPLLQALTP